MNHFIVILGPTASGKTALAVSLASQFKGEIISADSRQIYRGMDIGTGKDLEEYQIDNNIIKHHLIDILNPNEDYSVFHFKQDCHNAIKKIKSNNKIPIICGGTGLYIESVLLDYKIPNTIPNIKLRQKLERKTIQELTTYLLKLNKNEFKEDYHTSKRRLIRSIEILEDKKKINMSNLGNSILDYAIVIGLQVDRPLILDSIKVRLHSRLEQGMIAEVENLIASGLDYKRLDYFGLEYKFIGQYLLNQINYSEMVNLINIGINKFAKRQMTFFRRMEKRGIKINWFNKNQIKDIESIINSSLNQTS
ncbi:MAG: tRNA (adenosine(37)-N6)-dimethylallyltransferase MiaA [Candidatus Marinimicrobia bacterium]|nr:tRNA (adenosine(37)-N6)-dimethylallyltransferase MiaA [Candidatus Neomarinimicrobiota bacterium]|tara:strand:+ start:57202 stop:58122 length:921 start_codon:yes stop_codon:yes gene_type:complete